MRIVYGNDYCSPPRYIADSYDIERLEDELRQVIEDYEFLHSELICNKERKQHLVDITCNRVMTSEEWEEFWSLRDEADEMEYDLKALWEKKLELEEQLDDFRSSLVW